MSKQSINFHKSDSTTLSRRKKTTLAILGALNEIFYLLMPLMIVVLWILQYGNKFSFGNTLITLVAIGAMLYRTITKWIKW